MINIIVAIEYELVYKLQIEKTKASNNITKLVIISKFFPIFHQAFHEVL